jgi:hypothetical protein
LYGFLKEPILQKKETTESLPIECVPEEVIEPIAVVVPPSTSLSDLAASMLDDEVKQELREEVREVVREEVREVKRGEEEVRDLDFLDKSILATAVSSSIFLEVCEADEEINSLTDVNFTTFFLRS